MIVLLVDWLGRGGIAQCSDAWARVAASGGAEVVVATRRDRELAESWPGALVTGCDVHPLLAHGRLVRLTTRTIAAVRPDVIVLANYVVPWAEHTVVQAAHRVGASCIIVVHDHRLHTVTAGTRAGLGRLIRGCDAVVVHSAYVGERVLPQAGTTPVVTLPHPAPGRSFDPALSRCEPPWPAFFGRSSLLAVHFGVLRRRYKGTETLMELARSGVPDWCFALLGVGAPDVREPGCFVADRFLGRDELEAAVSRSDVTLLPYHYATQSGAVVLAQALGSVVVSTRVGGIEEQVIDGRTGVLLEPGADMRC